MTPQLLTANKRKYTIARVNNLPAPRTATRVQSWAAWALLALLLACAVPAISRFISTSAQWLTYPYPRAGSEGLILYESLLQKHGGDIYAPITPERFISGPYPPIFYWIAASLLPANLPDFSSPDSVTSIFEGGRIVSLLSTLAAAALIIALVAATNYSTTDRRLLPNGIAGGLVGATVFLAMPQVTVWATRFRGDMLMIALTAAGLVAIAIGVNSKPRSTRARWSWLVGGAILFALAFYTKQTALAGPIAAALFLLARDWRTGLRWCIYMFAAVLVPLIALELVTQHWFYLKMVSYHSLPIRRLTLERLLQFAFWEDQWPVILLAAAFALTSLLLAMRATSSEKAQTLTLRSTRQFRIPGFGLIPLFVLASLLTLPTGAVVGADHNHLLMSGLAVSLGVAALVTWLLDKFRHDEITKIDRSTGALWGTGLAVSALIAIYLVGTSPPSTWYDPDLTLPSAAQQEQMRKIVLNVAQNPATHFFADDPGVIALAGKQTDYDDPFTMSALAQQNRWDETFYREQLRTGTFGLLILSCDVTASNGCRGDTFTPGVLDAIREGYDLLFRDVLYTYAPKSR